MGFEFGAIWKDPEGGFIEFAVKRALKQDQTHPYGGETSCYSLLQGGVLSNPLKSITNSQEELSYE